MGCGTLGAGLQEGPSDEQTTCQGMSQEVPGARFEAGLVVRAPAREIAAEFKISVDSVRRWVKLAMLEKCPRKRRHFSRSGCSAAAAGGGFLCESRRSLMAIASSAVALAGRLGGHTA